MAGSDFGRILHISTWGESHGPALGAVLDGFPAGMELCSADLMPYMDRRKPGRSTITTQRKEADEVEILSGVFEGKTTGTPISLLIRNTSQRSGDYGELADCYRPGHADYSYDQKYGIRDYRGGGRSSGRETAARVACGAAAAKLLSQMGVEVCAFTRSIGPIEIDAGIVDRLEGSSLGRAGVQSDAGESPLACGRAGVQSDAGESPRFSGREGSQTDAGESPLAPDLPEREKKDQTAPASAFSPEQIRLLTATGMPDEEADVRAMQFLQDCMEEKDSAGGVVECVIRGVPAGIGDPVFHKLDAELASALMSIGAVKAVEIGDGIQVSRAKGSENNDAFVPGGQQLPSGKKEEGFPDDRGTPQGESCFEMDAREVSCAESGVLSQRQSDRRPGVVKVSNHAGGILGGISDGSPIVVRVHIKPTPSIFRQQRTVDREGHPRKLLIKGRHDPVIVPRAVVVVECMCALVILDAMLSNMTAKASNVLGFYRKNS